MFEPSEKLTIELASDSDLELRHPPPRNTKALRLVSQVPV